MLLAMLRQCAVAVFVLAACTPAASTQSAPPAPSTTQAPSATLSSASPTPSPPPATNASASATPAPIPLPTSAQVAAAGNGVVWTLVGGTRLFRSLDRGGTWEERPIPALPSGTSAFTAPAIAFVNDRDGWAMFYGQPGTQCTFEDVSLYRTSDGAATWQRLDTPSLPAAQCKGAIAFVDTSRGYITTWDPNSSARVLRTADGGRTWSSSAPLPDPPGLTTTQGYTVRGGTVSDFGAVLLVTAFKEEPTTEVHVVYRSVDAGATWTFASRAPVAMPPTVITTMRWIQILLPGQSHETTDGGASWHAYASDYAQAAPVAPQVAFGDANTGYATVRGGIQLTTDGGLHWGYIKTPGTLGRPSG